MKNLKKAQELKRDLKVIKELPCNKYSIIGINKEIEDFKNKIKKGCGKNVFKNGINEFRQKDNLKCGTKFANNICYCDNCLNSLWILK